MAKKHQRQRSQCLVGEAHAHVDVSAFGLKLQAVKHVFQHAEAAPSPALKAILSKLPVNSVGYLVGDLPTGFRRAAVQPFGAVPKSIVAYIQPAETGLDFVLTGAMEDEAQAKTFIQAASKLRIDALTAL